MNNIELFLWILSITTLGSWLYLWLFRSLFWLANQRLENNLPADIPATISFPSVIALIPARNEEDVIARCIGSLLNQDYQGELSIILIDDESNDRTVEVAQAAAAQFEGGNKVQIISGKQLPSGWAGKVWALQQGMNRAVRTQAKYYFLSDADVYHDTSNLTRLVSKAEKDELDLVSLMVKLQCRSSWDWLLIPAFIFFFQKLFPFNRVNDPSSRVAAAAGGSMLVRKTAMDRIGQYTSIKSAIIDDCTLARKLKENGPIWLGLSTTTRSIRAYDNLTEIWHMVTRSAYTQLHHSLVFLLGAIIGMTVVYVAPPMVMCFAFLHDLTFPLLFSGCAWGIMIYTYHPTLKLYDVKPFYGLLLPVTALIYLLMTIDSARLFYLNKGGRWKGRVYS
ncbi:MAG: glycosyl transferase family 2 [Rhodospirillaceae bacterium]|nr:glycosyl transferase family 2 [Rhodospirillaceae bacterium]